MKEAVNSGLEGHRRSMKPKDAVSKHYTLEGLGQIILAALEKSGKDVESLAVDDLAPVDEFHIRGRAATEELARWAEVQSHDEVLDVGCGLGGTARFLTSMRGCRVVGIDLTEGYCRVAEMLSSRVGLAERTVFQRASALDLPFEDGRFDVVWTEHVQMNIADKARFYRELGRVLKPNGQLAFHDIFAGDAQGAHYPVPWATDASISHLIRVEDVEPFLTGAGFVRKRWEDKSSESTTFLRNALQQVQKAGWMPIGLHLLMGDNATQKCANLLRNLEEGRVRVVQALMTRSASVRSTPALQ